ncbi:DNA damage-responsive transcriptional repressor-like protein [Elsinoe fawcettii]|nr:DNA damage-responsive transcriptional repressor-like protein [Elsinoe fawcettii]
MSSPPQGDLDKHHPADAAPPTSTAHDNLNATAPASALTPPTSEDNDVKHETQSVTSELSDIHESKIEEEQEQEEEIEPDHYYDGGKIPVFKPTMEQFRSFKKYVEKIDKYGMKAGIVKVIAPLEWRESVNKLDELVKTIRIKNPIMQEFMGAHGTYTQANIEKQRSYNLPEWKALTEETQNQPPARRGERRRGQAQIVRGGGNAKGRTPATPKPKPPPPAPGAKRRPGRPRKHPLPTPVESEETAPAEESGTPAPTTTDGGDVQLSIEEPEKAAPAPKQKKARAKGPRGPKGDTKKSVSSRRMNNQTEKVDVVDEAAFANFDYHMDGLDEFTPERCKELETAYWKSLTFAQPMYAADMPGSLFTDDVTSWNVAKLENLLDVLGTKVPGVNTAYLYMGMWKATFAWHLEDVDLYSINYIHFGAPKQWYSISQEDARKFEAAMKSVWPNDSKNCDQFLRHKTYLISPQLLKDRFNIEVNRLVHHEGEFVITYPYGYHSGYNLGYNCAESVNFALESWLDFGRIARKCECEADSVWVDVSEIERKLRGEPTPEYYEETDDDDDDEMEETGDLPTPPASVKGKTTGKKRKRDAKDKGADKPKKKIRIRIKTASREPCVLCPNDPIYEPLLPTNNGKKAHRACALYTPETYLSTIEGVETVMNVAGIDKARLDLKCNFCRSKRGACFQCASKKCTRAFHATCAAAAGVQIDCGPVPTFGEDGTEYFEEGFDLRCKFHRPRRPKNIEMETLENSKLINNYAKKLRPNEVVQVQYLGGDVFGGLVIENRKAEMAVVLEVLPEGDRVEVEWKYLLVLNPDDSQRPKPSAAAVPMPADMNKMLVSIDNRQDGVPKIDEIFHDNEANKWAEFSSVWDPPQGYRPGKIANKDQTKTDLSKPDQLYYYLGDLSTEAKCKFTDDPSKSRPVESADFMERVRIPAATRRAPLHLGPRPLQANGANAQSAYSVDASGRPYAYKPRIAPSPINTTMRRTSSAASSQGPPGSPFPPDAYYSSTTLPAAFPGQYSTYVHHVRTNSGDTHQRRTSITGHYANIAPRPPIISHAHPSLQPAPDLNAQDKAAYQSSDSSRARADSDIKGRENNVQWTPPSQIYHANNLDKAPFPPPQTQPQPQNIWHQPITYETPPQRPPAMHSSSNDWQHQIQEQANSRPQGMFSNPYRPQGQWGVWNGVNGLPNGAVQYQQPVAPAYGASAVQPAAAYQRTFRVTQDGKESPRQPTPSPLSEKDGRR